MDYALMSAVHTIHHSLAYKVLYSTSTKDDSCSKLWEFLLFDVSADIPR
jgi:hypothetical protein